MDFSHFINIKQQGKSYEASQLQQFVKGVVENQLNDAQIAAFTTSVYLNGLNKQEISDFSRAMAETGISFKWDLPGPIVDKHSTGGVGDLVSLVLGPILAACGAFVPMISGRSLGHTGGTIDKLESIPGYQTTPSHEDFRRCVKSTGVAIVGQSATLAPADKRIYAIRHQTSTVDSIGLITASILAKKYAEGLDALVIDVKHGNGAFMQDKNKARQLALSLANVADNLGIKCKTALTDMNSPLAYSVGNGLEVKEAVAFLTGERQHPCLKAVTLHLAAELLVAAKLMDNYQSAYIAAISALGSGQAAVRFGKMISELGGPSDFFEGIDRYLPDAKFVRPISAWQSGYIGEFDTRNVGNLAQALSKPDLGTFDHSTGLSELLSKGTQVEKGQPVVMLHAQNEQQWQEAKEFFIDHCLHITAQKPTGTSRIDFAVDEDEKELMYG